jgi:hypothetical protein
MDLFKDIPLVSVYLKVCFLQSTIVQNVSDLLAVALSSTHQTLHLQYVNGASDDGQVGLTSLTFMYVSLLRFF